MLCAPSGNDQEIRELNHQGAKPRGEILWGGVTVVRSANLIATLMKRRDSIYEKADDPQGKVISIRRL